MKPRMTLVNMAVTSERLVYRKPQALDLQCLFALYSDPRTQRFNPACPLKTLAQAEALLEVWIEHWDRQGYGWWAIAEQHAPEHIMGFGGVALHDYLAVDAWGKGYATELGRVALRWAFNTPGIRRVWAFAPITRHRSGCLKSLACNVVACSKMYPASSPACFLK
jgi:RimJ/RimL family protein N-acetyltransferase